MLRHVWNVRENQVLGRSPLKLCIGCASLALLISDCIEEGSPPHPLAIRRHGLSVLNGAASTISGGTNRAVFTVNIIRTSGHFHVPSM
jgi:hypothetical protein